MPISEALRACWTLNSSLTVVLCVLSFKSPPGGPDDILFADLGLDLNHINFGH